MTDLNDPRTVKAARAAEVRPTPGDLDWRRLLRRRLLVVGCLLTLWVLAIGTRLVHLQVLEHEWILEKAENQQQREVTIRAKRGDLVDRHGRLLAYSVDGEEIFADPATIDDPDGTAAAICQALDACGPDDAREIREKLGRSRSRYQVIKRRATVEEAARVRAIDGVGVSLQSLRYYPNRELAAHVLGWVNIDNLGMGGVEHAFEREIGGQPGRMLQLRDRRARALSLEVKQRPTMGANLQLTIDSVLQHHVERELEAAVRATRADGGVVVIMEPGTGDILAMAGYPTFNPNNVSVPRAEVAARRNRAVQDVYEYGSVVKVATAAAALDEGLFNLSDRFDVSAGMIQIGSRPPIRDVHTHSVLSLMDVIVKSSNVGIIKVGLRLGPERMDGYFRRFGFGSTVSRDFAAERSGNVWPRAKLTDSAIASMAMGYQIGITPLQMAAAVNSVANGGELVEPRLVSAISRNGVREERAPRVLRRTMTRATADQLRRMMEEVVERGTARVARVPGYTLAAKTGTAAKVVDGRYSKSLYNASLAGFVPSRSPVATILVTIDSPRVGGYYGSQAAGPVFKRITENVLRHFGVPPDDAPSSVYVVASRRDDERPAPTPVAMRAIDRPRPALAVQGLMPDLSGLGPREAVRTLARLGLVAELEGEGSVVGQSVAPGTPIGRGTVCRLWLSRTAAGAEDPGERP